MSRIIQLAIGLLEGYGPLARYAPMALAADAMVHYASGDDGQHAPSFMMKLLSGGTLGARM